MQLLPRASRSPTPSSKRPEPDRGFPPVAGPDARVLILGSLPGQASLAAGRYYAHPHNAFWPILGGFLGLAADAAYEERTAALVAAKIALWDVCAAARRPGSLDSAIARASVRPNDFAAFFRAHREIARIGFNGSAAYDLYKRQGLPADGRQLVRLPSTSPAHAAMSPAEKHAIWLNFLTDSLD